MACIVNTPRTRNRFEVPSETRRLVFMDAESSWNLSPLSLSPSETRQEQRKFRRIPVELHCLFSSGGPDEWSGTVFSLSGEGCAVRSTTPVHKGDYLRVQIFPGANQTPIEVGVAPVRWSWNEHFGLEFMMLTSRDAARLQDFLAMLGT